MIHDDPLEQFRRQIEKINDVQREFEKKWASLATSASLPSFEAKALHSAFDDRKLHEDIRRLLIGPDITSAVARMQSALSGSAMLAKVVHDARLTAAIDPMKAFAARMDDATRALRVVFRSPFQEALSSIDEANRRIPVISELVAGQVARHWREHGIDEDFRKLSERLEKIEQAEETPEAEIQEFGREVARVAEKKGLSISDLLGILVALFFYALGHGDLHLAENRLTDKNEKTDRESRQRDAEQRAILEGIVRALEGMKPPERPLFVVKERSAIVRTEPVSGASPVGILLPNQTVVLVEERAKWIYVEYFDLKSQAAQEGWVLKKYLKRGTPLKKKQP